MSTHIHCSGCTRHVEVSVNEQHDLIKRVNFKIGEGFHSDKPLETDLCVRCIDRITTNFFNSTETIKYDPDVEALLLGPPTMPRFLEEALTD
jgi:hypothetical protein